MQSKASTVAAYLKQLPAEHRAVVSAVRNVVRANLPRGYQETMDYGMIAWVIPLSRYPNTYNGKPLMCAALARQKHGFSLYLMGAYKSPSLAAELKAGSKELGKRLDMGKSCIRFKKVDDLPLDVIGKVVAAVPVTTYLEHYEKVKRK